MSELLSGRCPNCKNPLVYKDGQSSVFCECCDSTVNVSDMATGKSYSTESSASVKVGGVAASAMMLGFDNPESGVVFIENFFDNYDWADYQKHADIYIDELDEVVNNNKMKNGAVATAWYLDYKAVAVPVRKKIEGIADLAKNVGAVYNPDDDTEMLQVYDTYNNICSALVADKDEVLKRLGNSIKYAERFALDKARLSEMKTDFDALKELFDKEVKLVDDITKLPAYVAAQKALDKVKIKEFADAGIDAKAVYEEAVEQFNSSAPNKRKALSLFESIRGYKDSVKYINMINQKFSFKGELHRYFNKHYILKKEATFATLDVASLGKGKGKTTMVQAGGSGCSGGGANPAAGAAPTTAMPGMSSSSSSLSLYEIENGVPQKEPIVRGIVEIITCYGSKIFYFKEAAGICAFDVFDKTEKTIDFGMMSDYRIDGDFHWAVVNNGKFFYVQRKPSKAAPAAASGCGSKNQQPAPTTTEVVTENPYSIVVVDMTRVATTTVVPRFTEVVKRRKNILFYTFLTKETKTTKEASGCGAKPTTSVSSKIVLMSCNLATGKISQVLDKDCLVHDVYGDKVVYSEFEPNALNKNLYVCDLTTGAITLIEKNIYDFFDIVDGKIYYLVGNESYCPLMRNSFEGDAREEIMQNVENIISVMGGWLYVKKGRKGSLNSAIVKVSANGKKRVLLCTQYKENAEIHGNFVYYVDVFNSLRCVRIDGKKNVCIAEGVYQVWPTATCLYYVRYEQVASGQKALSLYVMDKTGHNIRKLAFNVEAVDYDGLTNTLYYKKKESAIFKAYKPNNEKEATQQVYELDKFYAMDMNTEETKLILTLGLPQANEVKSGCGGKKTDVDMIYEEVPFTHSYALERRKKEIQEEAQAQTNKTVVIPSNASGCGGASATQAGGNNAGCSGDAASQKKGAKSGCGA